MAGEIDNLTVSRRVPDMEDYVDMLRRLANLPFHLVGGVFLRGHMGGQRFEFGEAVP